MFEAVIVPHRSLSPRGLRRLVAFIVALSSGLSVGLWALGAWPAIGFSGAEVLLAVGLLRRNVRAARASELLLLTEAGLRVVRTDPRGRRWERVLEPSWLSVMVEERPGRVCGLFLAARGRRLEVGASLGEDEKRALATALGDALHRWRHPVFDNPQLRESPFPG